MDPSSRHFDHYYNSCHTKRLTYHVDHLYVRLLIAILHCISWRARNAYIAHTYPCITCLV